MKDFIVNEIQDSIQAKQLLIKDKNAIEEIKSAADKIIEAYKKGNKVLICGNGGSAGDSQHIAAEFVSKFRMDRRALPAIALTTNTSILTSIGNDYEYNKVFERQVEAYSKEGDILIGISTSGKSLNISRAFETAKRLGVFSIGLLGKDGGENKNYCDMTIIVPSYDTPRIQESHIMIGHIICDLVETSLFGEGNNE